jgi:acyl-CoA dehydrogenase
MLGPKNYLGIGWGSVPVMITVEGANILTRSLIIFGQGAIRCHPFVLREIYAAQDSDQERGLVEFDQALFGHLGYAISNAARSFVSAVTLARYVDAPHQAGATKRFYQHIARFSASFALAADVAMLTLGGALKKKEMLSSRLGDILSTLYLASTVLKHFDNQGSQQADLPVVEWACRSLLYKAQEQLHGFLRNFPNRIVARVLRVLIFPRGQTYYAPADGLSRRVVELMITPSDTRERLCDGVFRNAGLGAPLGELQEVMELAIAITPLEKKIRRGVKEGKVTAPDIHGQIAEAEAAGLLTAEEAKRLTEADARIMSIIDVDDFSSEDLARRPSPPPVAPRPESTKPKTPAPTPRKSRETEVAASG